MSAKGKLTNRDISWLSFNARVLQEAEDTSTPLIERLRFLGIFSNNQDEFFRVRVASIKRLAGLGKKAKEIVGESPAKVLKQIHSKVVSLQERFEKTYEEIRHELEKKEIYIINETQIEEEHKVFLRTYFREKVFPALIPIMIKHSPTFPYLKDNCIYLAIKLTASVSPSSSNFAVIEVPEDLDRFILLPSTGNKRIIILLDDVIRFCLDEVFSIFHYDTFEAWTVKLTRDAELDIEKDLSKSITEKITKGLKQRKKGAPVRFVYDHDIAPDILKFILRKIKIDKQNSLIPAGRYHNFKDFIKFPSLNRPELVYSSFNPVPHPVLKNSKSVLDEVRKRDVLLSTPYQTFDHVIDLLREASIDPDVRSIYITLYRAAKYSNVINALINAIKNGKEVVVVVELQARFDEQRNLKLANLLQEEGATVLFGIPDLKVHAKMILIKKKNKKSSDFAFIGTGNFNESTSKIYSDLALLTSNKAITSEVNKVFEFLRNNYIVHTYKHLVLAPFWMRQTFIKLLNKEVKKVKDGEKGEVIIKINNLVDEELIERLHYAADKGVKIKMIIRSVCAMPPHPNIEIISIVDRFLEHARVFCFGSGENEQIFISSADWMIRNLEYRVEVACPILDPALRKEIREYLQTQLSDNVKGRIINEDQDNPYRIDGNMDKVRSQQKLIDMYSSKLRPVDLDIMEHKN
jgi:polyphosphate kinase